MSMFLCELSQCHGSLAGAETTNLRRPPLAIIAQVTQGRTYMSLFTLMGGYDALIMTRFLSDRTIESFQRIST